MLPFGTLTQEKLSAMQMNYLNPTSMPQTNLIPPPKPFTNEPSLLFVYGTLQRNRALNSALNKATFFSKAETQETFLMQSIWFPMVSPVNATHKYSSSYIGTVVGELYEITPDILIRIDQVEGTPWLFKRQKTICLSSKNTPHLAFIYLGATVPHPKDSRLLPTNKLNQHIW